MKVEAKEIRRTEDIFFEALSSVAIPRKLSYQILGRENPDQRLAV